MLNFLPSRYSGGIFIRIRSLHNRSGAYSRDSFVFRVLGGLPHGVGFFKEETLWNRNCAMEWVGCPTFPVSRIIMKPMKKSLRY
jgi:hypothetical protein